MNDLCDRIIELLGNTIQDPTFTQFMEDLGERPKAMSPMFVFAKHGFSVVVQRGVMGSVFFELDNGRNDWIQLYTGTLPLGLTVDDCLDDVQRKLGSDALDCEQADDHSWYLFKATPYVLKIAVDLETEKLLTVMLGLEELQESEMNNIRGTIVRKHPRARMRTRHRHGSN